jgi:hypothetical protein
VNVIPVVSAVTAALNRSAPAAADDKGEAPPCSSTSSDARSRQSPLPGQSGATGDGLAVGWTIAIESHPKGNRFGRENQGRGGTADEFRACVYLQLSHEEQDDEEQDHE